MPLIALGLNHKTAPVAIREQVAFEPTQIITALNGLVALPAINEAAILSTCNRTEIYCNIDKDDDSDALQWFLKQHGLELKTSSDFLYRHFDELSIRHMLRVACGLDSMVLGEPQILGQLKTAYRQAEEAGTVGSQLSRLFQYAFSVAKHVRSETAIGANPVSVAFAAVSLAKQIFTDLHQQTALMVGAGETIELAARHLRDNNIGRMMIANRSIERAQDLARQVGGEPMLLSSLPDFMPQADIIISSTASQLPIIGKGAVESALKQRRRQPMFMVDIAVPRDIEPEVGALRDVYLYNVDDLEAVIAENRKSRQAAADQAETIIDQKVEEFLEWQRSLQAVHTIRTFRDNAQFIRQQALDKALHNLAQGKSAEEVLELLAHTLTNKLLHTPTTRLDQAAREGRLELLEAASEILKPKEQHK